MLFGYVFNITIVSAIVNVFFSVNAGRIGNTLLAVLIPLTTIAVIFIIMRIPKFRALEDHFFEKLANRLLIRRENVNPVLMLDYIGKDTIAQVTLDHVPEKLAGVSLSESRLRSETGILIMLVEHPGSSAEVPGPDTVFEKGDKLTVFGDHQAICRAFDGKEFFADS